MRRHPTPAATPPRGRTRRRSPEAQGEGPRALPEPAPGEVCAPGEFGPRSWATARSTCDAVVARRSARWATAAPRARAAALGHASCPRRRAASSATATRGALVPLPRPRPASGSRRPCPRRLPNAPGVLGPRRVREARPVTASRLARARAPRRVLGVAVPRGPRARGGALRAEGHWSGAGGGGEAAAPAAAGRRARRAGQGEASTRPDGRRLPEDRPLDCSSEVTGAPRSRCHASTGPVGRPRAAATRGDAGPAPLAWKTRSRQPDDAPAPPPVRLDRRRGALVRDLGGALPTRRFSTTALRWFDLVVADLARRAAASTPQRAACSACCAGHGARRVVCAPGRGSGRSRRRRPCARTTRGPRLESRRSTRSARRCRGCARSPRATARRP